MLTNKPTISTTFRYPSWRYEERNMTVRARFTFNVKGSANGTPWIAFEPLEGQLQGEGLPPGIFGFDLPEGTTGEKATEIAGYLDDHLASFSFTRLALG
jgi:hypothetical protein